MKCSRPRPRAAARRRGSRVAAAFAVGTLALLAGLVVWAGVSYLSISRELEPSDAEVSRQLDAVLDEPPRADAAAEPTYILVLGADRRPGQGAARSDTILIVRVDPDDRSVSMLSIPRDTRVSVPGYGQTKINHANAYGGPSLAVQTVQEHTGLPVHHFVELDFAGFAQVVDALGGVRITVERAIDDRYGSDTGGVSDVTKIPAGRQRLNGAQALTFVRSRAYPDGDFTRVRNQQKLLVALLKEAMKPVNLLRLPSIAESIASHLDTDMSVGELVRWLRVMDGVADDDIRGFVAPGRTSTIDGVSYVIPDGSASRALFEAFHRGEAVAPGGS